MNPVDDDYSDLPAELQARCLRADRARLREQLTALTALLTPEPAAPVPADSFLAAPLLETGPLFEHGMPRWDPLPRPLAWVRPVLFVELYDGAGNTWRPELQCRGGYVRLRPDTRFAFAILNPPSEAPNGHR